MVNFGWVLCGIVIGASLDDFDNRSHRCSQGDAWGAGAPPAGRLKTFCTRFCGNEAKMGLNLVRCSPADETKKVVGGSIGRTLRCKIGWWLKRSSDFWWRKSALPPPDKILLGVWKKLRQIRIIVVNYSNDWVGPPHDSDWSISDVHVNESTRQCLGDWVCEHRWPIISSMVVWRSVAADRPLRHWWDDGARQIAFSRAGGAFIAINDDQRKTMDVQLVTGLPAGVYCDVASGTVSYDNQQCTGRTVTGHHTFIIYHHQVHTRPAFYSFCEFNFVIDKTVIIRDEELNR